MGIFMSIVQLQFVINRLRSVVSVSRLEPNSLTRSFPYQINLTFGRRT